MASRNRNGDRRPWPLGTSGRRKSAGTGASSPPKCMVELRCSRVAAWHRGTVTAIAVHGHSEHQGAEDVAVMACGQRAAETHAGGDRRLRDARNVRAAPESRPVLVRSTGRRSTRAGAWSFHACKISAVRALSNRGADRHPRNARNVRASKPSRLSRADTSPPRRVWRGGDCDPRDTRTVRATPESRPVSVRSTRRRSTGAGASTRATASAVRAASIHNADRQRRVARSI